MLKSLLRIRLASLAGWIMGTSRAKKKGSTAKAIGYGLLFLYVFGVFGALFFLTFGSLGDAYHTLELDWLYFALFAVADLALMFIFSVFTAKSQLFEAKDNELLLSMPIPPRQILTSRLVMLLGINYLFELIVAVPAGISGHFATPWGVFSFVVLCLVLPLFSAALSSFLGGSLPRSPSTSATRPPCPPFCPWCSSGRICTSTTPSLPRGWRIF